MFVVVVVVASGLDVVSLCFVVVLEKIGNTAAMLSVVVATYDGCPIDIHPISTSPLFTYFDSLQYKAIPSLHSALSDVSLHTSSLHGFLTIKSLYLYGQ